MSKLSTDAIILGMAEALPTHEKDDDSSDLSSSYEAIALLVHSYLAAIGFKLLGFDEEKPIAEAQSLAPRIHPSWNNGFGSLSFVYSHKQSSMRFVFRIDRMGTKVEVRGLAAGHDEIHRFEKAVRNVVSSSALPIRITMTDNREDRSDLPQKLRKAFVSEEAITDVLHDLKVKIVQKLIPKLQSEGYIEEAEAEANARTERLHQESRDPNRPVPRPANPYEPYQPFAGVPPAARAQPAPTGEFPPPDFEDEHQILSRPGRNPYQGINSPYNIGHDDLNPPGLGPHDPLRGSFIGGGLPRPGGGSGMHPTFDDPLFTGQGGGVPGGPGQGYNPQAPPGARWDPTGPGGNPRFPGPQGGSGGFGGYGGYGGGGII